MSSRFRLIEKDAPHTVYETGQETFLVGRSEDCAIAIQDPHVSRVQARIWFDDGQYRIENIGKNPTLVNGTTAAGQVLHSGDEITLGATRYQFEAWMDQASFSAEPEPLRTDRTVALQSVQEQLLGPRLVVTGAGGASRVYPINTPQVSIGRSADVDIRLDDRAVSRTHCLIEKREDEFFAKNLSDVNPVWLNEQQISQARLFTGDQLRLGSFTVEFISDRPVDVRPREEKIITRERVPLWAVYAAVALVAISLGILGVYRYGFRPWRLNRALDAVSAQISSGDYEGAQHALESLVASDLPTDMAPKANQLLVQTVLQIANQMATKGRLGDAKAYLTAFLQDYGWTDEAALVWDGLDLIRLQLARQMEGAQQFQDALRQYATVRENGVYFDEAQKGIRRIWLTYQQQQRRDQNLAQLLQEAESHFSAKRYLTPVNRNAYSVYQAVLEIDPQNAVALQRIEQMKAFYREFGERYLANRDSRKALTYFERYSVIDPDDAEVKRRIIECRDKLESAASQTSKTTAAGQPASKVKQEKIKRLLEESGTDSAWIMKYLFEEKSGEKDSDKPW